MLPASDHSPDLNRFIVERINAGIFAVDRERRIILWNKFMEAYSGKLSQDILGQHLFTCFPELPAAWLERKIQGVFTLKNYAFTSWEQRPYLFKFPHNRPVTGGIDYMQQNCTFLPVKNHAGEVDYVCITLFDATDTCIYQLMLQEAMASLADASNRDGLTGLYNRRFFDESMAREFSRSRRYQAPLSLILLDIDHFKKINDTYGHLAGDEVLKTTAQQLMKSVRDADTVARYGGEEFVIILPETPLENAMILADRLRVKIADTKISYGDTLINITISLGVTELHSYHERYVSLTNEADQALYASKNAGRNRATRYTPEAKRG